MATSSSACIGSFTSREYRINFYLQDGEVLGERILPDGASYGPYPLDRPIFEILPIGRVSNSLEECIKQLKVKKYVPVISNGRVTWLAPESFSSKADAISKGILLVSPSNFSSSSPASLIEEEPAEKPLVNDFAIALSANETATFQELIQLGDSAFDEGDFEKAEESYVNALDLVQLTKDKEKILLCLKSLAAVYITNHEEALDQRKKRLIQAAGMYNYCLRLAAEEEKALIRNKLAEIEVALITFVDGNRIDESCLLELFDANRATLKAFRAEIDEKIKVLSEEPDPEVVFALHHEIAEGIKEFTRGLIAQVIESLGEPPCKFTIIGFGSLAREEVTPYSDLEFGILIAQKTKEARKYFRNLTYLLQIKVVNLGETILPALNILCLKKIQFYDDVIPRGFAFDGEGVQGKGCKTPLGNGTTFKLIQTPEKMAQYIGRDKDGKWWYAKEPHLPMEMLNFTWIIEEHYLVERYQRSLDQQLEQVVEGENTLRQYLAKKHLKEEDEINFDPTLDKLEDQGKFFQVKKDLYRLPHLFIDRLALMYKIMPRKTCERIDSLNQERIINKAAKKRLIWLISTIVLQRLKVYSHYRAQKEIMNPLLYPFTLEKPELAQREFILNPKALENLTKIYQILIPFYRAVSDHLKGNQNYLHEETLYDESPITIGKIAARLLQYEKAKEHYLEAQHENPNEPAIFTMIGFTYSKLGELKEAYLNHMQALELNKNLFGERHLDIATSLNNVGHSLEELRKYKKALEYFQKALEIRRDLLGEKHLHIAASLNDVGTALGELGDNEEALKYKLEALELKKTFFADRYVSIATSLNNVGHTLRELRRYQEALKYLHEALELRRVNLGERHPDVAVSLNNIAQVWQELAKYEEAIKYFKEALTIRIVNLGEKHPGVATSLSNLGDTLRVFGNHKEALKCLQDAHEILKVLSADRQHPHEAAILNNIGAIFKELEKYDEALKYMQKALELTKSLHGERHSEVAKSLNNIGMILSKLERRQKALSYIQRAVKMSEETLGINHPQTIAFNKNLQYALR